MASVDCLWMVDLALNDITCSGADLKQLTSLRNLRALQVLHSTNIDAASQFDDSVLSYLGSRAAMQGALPRLEVISLSNTKGITPSAFESLNNIPALGTIYIHNTSIKASHKFVSRKYGWYRDVE